MCLLLKELFAFRLVLRRSMTPTSCVMSPVALWCVCTEMGQRFSAAALCARQTITAADGFLSSEAFAASVFVVMLHFLSL